MVNIEQYQDTRLENLQKQIKSLECTHPNKKVRYKLASNNTKMFKLQCVRCGELFGEWISHYKIKNQTEIKEIDENLIYNFNQTICELKKALNDRVKDLNKIDFHEWYGDYLKSDGWFEKRMLVFERCGGRCEGCGIKRSTQVHHKTYANVGKEFLFELVGLCIDCHERIHKETGNENTY